MRFRVESVVFNDVIDRQLADNLTSSTASTASTTASTTATASTTTTTNSSNLHKAATLTNNTNILAASKLQLRPEIVALLPPKNIEKLQGLSFILLLIVFFKKKI